MAKEALVTRRFQTTVVDVLCLDIETAEPLNQTVTITKVFKDDARLMKALHEIVDTDTVKAVSIVGKEVKEKLYGISEADFIANAKELDPETRKALN